MPRSFLVQIFQTTFERLGFLKPGFRIDDIAFVWMRTFFMIFGSGVRRFLDALEAVFLVFYALKTSLKSDGFLVCTQISSE